MLEQRSRRLLLVSAAALALALAVAPVAASGADPEPTTDEARGTAAENAPETGTAADPIVDDVLDPDADPTNVRSMRERLADDVPQTGTGADGAVSEVLSPEGDPEPDTSPVDKLRRDAATRAASAIRLAWSLVPEDPVKLVGEQVDPIAQAANGALGESEAYEVEEPAPASGEAVAVAPEIAPELIVAGAGAAAAAALVAFWLAGSSGSLGAAGTAGAGASGASGSSELRRLLPFASPLFTRFEKDTVLGHPKREQLYALILQDPGVSLQALCDKTGLSRTAVTHHLRLLEMQHLIVSKRMGRSRHYFENGGRFGRDQKDAYAVLHNLRTKDVARWVRDHPGAIQKELCAGLGIQPSIAHWHLSRLQQAQLVEPVRHGRTVSYFPGPGLKNLDQPVVPREALAAAQAPEPLPEPVLAPAPMIRALPA